ncbi:MAG: hypothetical protein HZA91_16075 [Verrucomicrobia bacterium]|nr:hypothetical protein [Verrucomicrobiota bacterium]
MKKMMLGLLAGAAILLGGASVSSAQGFFYGHHGRHHSYGFGFGFPGYYSYGGCYRPAPVYCAPSYYSYPSYGYYNSYPAYGYGYYPGYSYSYTTYGW